MELFSKRELKFLPDRVCGIYGLVYNREVIYIGQSVNLKARIGKHYAISSLQEAEKRMAANPSVAHQIMLSRYQFIQSHKEQVYWVILAQCTVHDLNRLEQQFIQRYKPKYNYLGVVKEYRPEERWIFDKGVEWDVVKMMKQQRQKELLERL